MLDFKKELEITSKEDKRYHFLLCTVFSQSLSMLLKKLEEHNFSLYLLEKKKKKIDYENFIGLINKRGEYFHCYNLFKAYEIDVPDSIYQVYRLLKLSHKKHDFKSNILDSDVENILQELFDISYYQQFKAENMKHILEQNLVEKDSINIVKI